MSDNIADNKRDEITEILEYILEHGEVGGDYSRAYDLQHSALLYDVYQCWLEEPEANSFRKLRSTLKDKNKNIPSMQQKMAGTIFIKANEAIDLLEEILPPFSPQEWAQKEKKEKIHLLAEKIIDWICQDQNQDGKKECLFPIERLDSYATPAYFFAVMVKQKDFLEREGRPLVSLGFNEGLPLFGWPAWSAMESSYRHLMTLLEGNALEELRVSEESMGDDDKKIQFIVKQQHNFHCFIILKPDIFDIESMGKYYYGFSYLQAFLRYAFFRIRTDNELDQQQKKLRTAIFQQRCSCMLMNSHPESMENISQYFRELRLFEPELGSFDGMSVWLSLAKKQNMAEEIGLFFVKNISKADGKDTPFIIPKNRDDELSMQQEIVLKSASYAALGDQYIKDNPFMISKFENSKKILSERGAEVVSVKDMLLRKPLKFNEEKQPVSLKQLWQ